MWFLLNGKTTDKLLNEAYELSEVPNNRELDVLLSSGEQISISKLSILLNDLGYTAISLTGWQAGIYTSSTNQNAVIESIDTTRIIKELNDKKIVIIAGFQGYNLNLDITTLGRGGSDTTAVALAAALNAKHCYIFSDVDGVYSADPNKVSNTKKMKNLSYIEMLDISGEGAKVLHNRCIEIGEKYNIPIITKSTFNNKSGSVINNKIEENIVKSIVKNDDIVWINIYTNYSANTCSLCPVKLNDAYFYLYNVLISHNIYPIQFLKNNLSSSIDCYIKKFDFNMFKKLINKFTDKMLNDLNLSFNYSSIDISRIAVIGYGITSNNIISKQVMDVIHKYNIEVFNIDITNTKIIYTFKEKVDNEVLQELHDVLFSLN